jgi:hypothetical protein
MSKGWSRYLVRLAVSGSPIEAFASIVSDLQQELDARPHLFEPSVRWDVHQSQILVDVYDEDYDPETAGRGMREELLEVIPTVLRDFDEVRVEILGVSPAEWREG